MPAKKGGEEWKVGDKVEADFNGEWFPATVSKVMTRGKIQVDWGDSLSTITRKEVRLLPGDRKKVDELFQVSDDESMHSQSDSEPEKKSSKKKTNTTKGKKKATADSDSEDDKNKKGAKKPGKKASAAKAAGKKSSKKPSESESSDDDDDDKKKKKGAKKPSAKKAAAKKTSKQTNATSSEDESEDDKKAAKKSKPSKKKAAAKKATKPKTDSSSEDSSDDDKKKKKPPSKKSTAKEKSKRSASTDDEKTKRPKPDSKKSKAKSKKAASESDDEIDNETLLEALTQMESLLVKSKDIDPTVPKGKLAVAQLKALAATSTELPQFKKSFTPLLRDVRRKIREIKEGGDTKEVDKKKSAPKGKGKEKEKEKVKRGEGTDSEEDRVKKPKIERTDSNSTPKPRKPLTAQQMHAASVRKKLAKEHPDKTSSEINELISDAWKELSSKEKSALETKNKEATTKWEAAVKEWEKANKESGDSKGKETKKAKEAPAPKEEKKKKKKELPSVSLSQSFFALANYVVDVEEAMRNGLSSRRSATALVSRGKDIAKAHDTLYRLDFSDKDLTLYDIHKECCDKLRQHQAKHDINDFHTSILTNEPPSFKKSAQQLFKQTVLADITKDDPKMSAKAINAAVSERWGSLDKEALKEWRQKQKDAKDEHISNFVSKERFRYGITKEQVETLAASLKELSKNDDLPDALTDIFKVESLPTLDLPSDETDLNKDIKTVAPSSPGQLLSFAREVFEMTKFKKRDPMSADDRKELKKKYVDELDNSRDHLVKLREKIFGQFCEQPTAEAKDIVQKFSKKVQGSLGERLMDIVNSSEFETTGWDPLLFEIRDIIDELDLEDKQPRRVLKPFTFGLTQKTMAVAKVVKLLPHESTVTLDKLPNPTALRSCVPHHLFGDAVQCWLYLHVFAQAFRLTRFPLHQFMEAVTTAAETKLLKAIFCQLLGCINNDDGESKRWPDDVTALLAKETNLDEHDSDSDTESDESADSSDSDSSSAQDSDTESDSDSDSASESESESVSVSSSSPSGSGSSSSLSSDGSNSDSDSDTDASSNSDSSSSLPKKKLTDRQKATLKRQKEQRKEAAKKAAEKKAQDAIDAVAKKKKAKERKKVAKANAKQKKAEEKKRKAEEKAKAKEERAKEKEESKLTDEEKELLRRGKAEDEYAAGDYLSEAIRQAIDSAREANETAKDWDLPTRIIFLKGLLRKASSSKQITEGLRDFNKRLKSIKSSLTAQENATNKQHQVSLAQLKESGTKEGKGYDSKTTLRIEEAISEYKSTVESLRFESWLKTTANDPCCRPLGSDRHGRLYFKFPTDHRLYVYTHRTPLKTLNEVCGVIEGAEQDQKTFADNDDDDDEMDDVEATQQTQPDETEAEKDATATDAKPAEEEKPEESKAEEKKADSPKKNEEEKKEVDKQSESEGEERSEPDSDAEVVDEIPDWIVMNGSWGTYPIKKIIPLLSMDTCQEFALRTTLESIQNFLPLQQTRKMKNTPAAMDIRKYVNKYTTYGFGYLPDEDKADP